jgi:hypothetical protein
VRVCVRVYVRACVRAHDAHVRGGARFLRVGVRVARLLSLITELTGLT